MPFTKFVARRRIRKASRASGKLAHYQATPEPTFLSRQRPVQKRRRVESKWQRKVAELDRRIARARAKLAMARRGMIGTRRIRTKIWSKRETKLVNKRVKPAARLTEASQLRQQTENAFSGLYQANVAVRQTAKNSALLKMNNSLNKMARSISRMNKKMQEDMNVIEHLNNSFPAANQVPAAQLVALRNKIQTEATNPDQRIGTYRLLHIWEELETVENLVDAGQQARAGQIIAQLVALNENPPN